MSSRTSEGRIERGDAPSLFVRAWRPRQERPRGTLQIVHGLGEHGGRYGELVERFVGDGWRVVAGDLRGFGRSEGRRGHVRSFDEYVDDVAAVAEWTDGWIALPDSDGDEATDGPRVVYGHSMGGVVAARYALDAPAAERPDVLVLSSPGFAAHPDAAPNPLLHAAAFVLARVAPGLHIASGLDPSAISRDPEVVAAYESDPLVQRQVTPAWYVAFLAAQDDAMARIGTLAMPLVVAQAGADRLVDPAATRRAVAAVARDRVDVREWPGLFHELHHEPERDEVFDWIAGRLDERL